MIDEKVGPNGVRLFSMRETMKRIGCARETVKKLIRSGDLRSFQYTDEGWHWVFKSSLDGYLKRRSLHNARHKRQPVKSFKKRRNR